LEVRFETVKLLVINAVKIDSRKMLANLIKKEMNLATLDSSASSLPPATGMKYKKPLIRGDITY
jgi:hypothetical protein